MSNFTVNNEELDQLSTIFSKHGLKNIVENIEKEKKANSSFYYLERIRIFNNKFVVNNNELLKSLYNYTKDKSFNIAHFFEQQVLHAHNWSDEFSGYVRLIKNTDYALRENQKFYSIINKQAPSTQNIFWGLVSLAPLIQNNQICTQAFYLILKDKLPKMSSFGLLEIEKIKRIWDKRFKEVDANTLPSEEYQYITDAFNKAINGKNQSFCTTTSGNYLNITINVDLVSQANKKSKNVNGEALQMFFNCFSSYIKKNPHNANQLSLSSVKAQPDGYDINVMLCYDDMSHTSSIKTVFDDLLNYAITKDNDGNLQANSIKDFQAEKFFSTFIMNHILENSLDKKIETVTKKNKL